MNFDDLPEKQQKFIDLYLDLGDRDDAYHKAGYSIEGRGWKANARKLFLQLQSVIDARIEVRIGEGSVMALDVLKKLMLSDDVSPAVRRQCANDYLDLAGRKRPHESRITITDESKMSDKDLDAEIIALQEKLGGGKLVVSPEDKLH